MTEELHLVTEAETTTLLGWLEMSLPESWGLYGIVREQVRYNWPGYTFYTLGWPEIQAAALGEMENTDCECAEYFTHTRKLAIFSQNEKSLGALLSWPGFLDWSKTTVIRVPEKMKAVVHDVIKCKGKIASSENTFHVMMAHEGDIMEKPIPEGINVCALDAELHAGIMNKDWKYKRAHSEDYIKAMLKFMPSVGVFSRSKELLGYVMGTDSGTVSLLYVTPDMRGQGLGSVLTSQLAGIYFKLGLPAVSYCHVDNQPSIKMEEKLGFKKSTQITFIYLSGDA